MSRHTLGAKLQQELPRVFRVNRKAPATPVWSDLWVDAGWVKLCESSDPEALREEGFEELRWVRING